MPVTIRLATPDDSPAILAIYSPIVTDTVISFEAVPPTLDALRGRVEATLAAGFPWLVCTIDEAVAGYVYAGTYRKRAAYQWSVEVTAYVHSDYRRRGVGKGLYSALFDLLRLQGYYMAYAGITLPNDASVGLHEALGFTPIGVYHDAGYKHDQWWDVGWWEMALRDRPPHPEAPRSIHEVLIATMADRAFQSGALLIK